MLVRVRLFETIGTLVLLSSCRMARRLARLRNIAACEDG